jgi:MFS family permease
VPAPTSTFASLAVRNYRLYFIGQGLSGAGSWMQNVAVGWLALEVSHSGLVLGAVTAARYVPLVLVGPWGGLVVDRTDTRRLLKITQIAAGTLSLALAVLTYAGLINLAGLLVIVLALGAVDIFDVPARQSIIGALVDPGRLGNAIALNSVMTNAARALGPALAGTVIAFLGIATCFFINAVSFAAVFISIVLMRASELLPTRRETASKGQIRAGLQYVRRSPWLLTPLVMVAVTGTLTWAYPVSLPLLTAGTFHGDAAAYGFAMSALGVGSVVGGFVAARWQVTSTRGLALASVLWGAADLAVAVAPRILAVYALMLVVGFFAITFNSGAKTVLQIGSEVHMRGRVMSLWFMAWQGSTVIGGPLVGAVGGAFGARYGVALGGVAALLVGAAYLGRTPPRAPAPADQDAVEPEPSAE